MKFVVSYFVQTNFYSISRFAFSKDSWDFNRESESLAVAVMLHTTLRQKN